MAIRYRNGYFFIFIGNKEIFRVSHEGLLKAAGVVSAILGTGIAFGIVWAIASLAAATTPLAYLLYFVCIAFCILAKKKLEKG